jgi:quercetin dioxygenase-like cupin family protein
LKLACCEDTFTERLKNLKTKEMKKNRSFRFSAMLTVTLAALAITSTALAQQSGVKRTELQRHDLSSPGREVVHVRIDFDSGVPFMKHTHPGEEIIYVLEGLLEYQVEGKPPITLKAGDVLFIPAETIHSAKNVGSGNAAELATYVVEKGKPLVAMVK